MILEITMLIECVLAWLVVQEVKQDTKHTDAILRDLRE